MQNTQHSPVTSKSKQAVYGLISLLVLLLVVNVTIYLQPAKAYQSPSVDEQYLLNLINQERTSRGLSALTYNNQLHEAAQAKAEDMLKNGYFEHISPSGKTPWIFIKTAGYDYLKAGENLAIDFTSVKGPVEGWMNSPTHRANILKADYEETGIAEVKGTYQGRETTIVVEEFGTKPFSLRALTGK